MLRIVSIIFILTAFNTNPVLAWNFDEVVKTRVESLDLVVKSKFNNRVKKELNVYLNLDNSQTEMLLERMVQYFPLIEQKIRERGLPSDLKYIVIAESRIDPMAISGDGAMGLWQLMPATARELGLRIDSDIDERRDPEKSTEAALNYLEQLYAKLNDWPLAIAAYNGGYVRINRAIRKSGTRDFEKLKKHLPKETAEFKDRIVGGAYICRYYNYHFFLTPEINLDLQLTREIKIYNHAWFKDIAKKTGVPIFILRQLNPMYKKDYVPGSVRGFSFYLPERVMDRYENQQLISHLQLDRSFYNPYVEYTKLSYQAEKNEDIYSIAKVMNTDPFKLKYWNKIEKLVVRENRELAVYRIK